MTANTNPITPDALASDMLYGVAAIATYTGIPERKIYHYHARHLLPTFKLGAIVCARKSQLRDALAAKEVA